MPTSRLGFTYKITPVFIKQLPAPEIERGISIVRENFNQIIYDTVKIEGNPVSLADVEALLNFNTTVNVKESDIEQVINQAASWHYLLEKIKSNTFLINKETFCELHSIAAKKEALKWGVFRDREISGGLARFIRPAPHKLDSIFKEGVEFIKNISNPLERALVFFLFGSFNQFFFDVNKRTSRLMMNGILLSNGYEPINIPSERKLESSLKMAEFFTTRDGTEVIRFLINCSISYN